MVVAALSIGTLQTAGLDTEQADGIAKFNPLQALSRAASYHIRVGSSVCERKVASNCFEIVKAQLDATSWMCWSIRCARTGLR